MIIIDELDQVEATSSSSSNGRVVSQLAAVLVRRRRFLAVWAGLGVVLGVVLAFLIPSEYTSAALLMPLDQQSVSTAPSILNPLAGVGSIASAGSGLMSQKTPGGTAIGILGSRTVLDNIINRFDLRRVYRCKLYIDAEMKLTKRTIFEENKKSGIISIAVIDHDRYRARDITQAYVEELDTLLNSLNTSSARRERIFLEERLKSIKTSLDASSLALSQFSSRNATFDPQKQGEATVLAAGKLQGEVITAQSELSGLRVRYSDDNVRVRQLRGRISELQKQLARMDGSRGEQSSGVGASGSGDQLPSVRELPILGLTYYDLYRQVTIQEALYESLSKQYELAQVQEAKEIPRIKILDAPELPERRSSPHRGSLMALTTLLSTLVGVICVVTMHFWSTGTETRGAKGVVMELWRAVRSDRSSSVPGAVPAARGSRS